MLHCKLYDGQTDPKDHIIHYKNCMGRCNIPLESIETVFPIKEILPLKRKDLSKEQNGQIMRFEKDTPEEEREASCKGHPTRRQ